MDDAKKQALVAKMQADKRECDAAYREMTSDPAYGRKFWLTRKEIAVFTLCIVAVFWPIAGAKGVLAALIVYFVTYILRLNAAIEKRAAKRKQQ